MTLEIIPSAALAPIRHGFFTRKGGASSGIFAGLNCGTGSTDQSDVVVINRARVADAMGLAPDHLISVRQIHSANVLTMTDPASTKTPADGMVTNRQGLALAVLTADCQPVLFADPKARVIGAAHAGWRGAQDGVLEATIEAMLALGATRPGIRAAIGPCISQRAYEVGPEFFDSFRNEDPANTRFFVPGKGDRLLFDLPAYGLHRLRRAAIGHAEWTGHCTYTDSARFYSYRRSVHLAEADYGRLISVIRL